MSVIDIHIKVAKDSLTTAIIDMQEIKETVDRNVRDSGGDTTAGSPGKGLILFGDMFLELTTSLVASTIPIHTEASTNMKTKLVKIDKEDEAEFEQFMAMRKEMKAKK